MCTATESDHVAVTVRHGAKQRQDLLVSDGRIDAVAELEKLVPGKSALLAVINQSECVHNGGQRNFVQFQIPSQQNLQASD